MNFEALLKYKKNINIFSFTFFKKLKYRISHPSYFTNLLWIISNSVSSLDILLMKFAENNSIKIRHYLDEANVNVLSKSDYHRFLYVIVRILKPNIMVETGVNEGFSSQAILSAMYINNFGKLYSIDLPNVSNADDLRSYNLNERDVGYVIPTHLRERWELRLGDAKILLPTLLRELDAIDIFLHDSLHTFDHMSFEYSEAWSSINSTGLLISHDIQMNTAFKDFFKNHHRQGKNF